MVVPLDRALRQKRRRKIIVIISIILTLSLLVRFPLPRSYPWLVWRLVVEVISWMLLVEVISWIEVISWVEIRIGLFLAKVVSPLWIVFFFCLFCL